MRQAFFILILLLLLAGCKKKDDEKSTITPIKPDFVVKTLIQRQMPTFAIANLQASKIAIIEAQTGGKIAEITVRLGSNVKKGTILGELDNALTKATYEKVKSEIERMQAELSSFQAQLIQIVKKEGVGDESSNLQHEIDAQLKDIADKKSQMKDLEIELKASQIISPINGVITGVVKQPGQVIVKGDKLFQVEDISVLTGYYEINENEAVKTNAGDEIVVNKGDEEFNAEVRLVQKDSGIYKVTFIVDSRRLKSGMSVRVPLAVKKLDLASIPKFLLQDGYIWVIKDMQVFKEKVNIRDEDQNTVYTDSFPINTVLVDGHNTRLKEGMIVKVNLEEKK